MDDLVEEYKTRIGHERLGMTIYDGNLNKRLANSITTSILQRVEFPDSQIKNFEEIFKKIDTKKVDTKQVKYGNHTMENTLVLGKPTVRSNFQKKKDNFEMQLSKINTPKKMTQNVGNMISHLRVNSHDQMAIDVMNIPSNSEYIDDKASD
jgi:hypothetical protein